MTKTGTSAILQRASQQASKLHSPTTSLRRRARSLHRRARSVVERLFANCVDSRRITQLADRVAPGKNHCDGAQVGMYGTETVTEMSVPPPPASLAKSKSWRP